MDFLRLDLGSQWVSGNLIRHFLRTGDLAQAREIANKLGDIPHNTLVRACLNHAASRGDSIDIAKKLEADYLANPDPENRYAARPPLPSAEKTK